jgi:signal transduction histidine kinase
MNRVLPLSVKIPAVVFVFMAAVALFVSERVLTRLQEAQSRHLADLATVYLDGLASALVDPVVREDVWGVFDILDGARQTQAGMKPIETVVATTDGRVLASSDPVRFPSRSPLPDSFLNTRTPAPATVSRDSEGLAVSRRDLSTGGQAVGSVHATFDIAPLLEERRSVLLALIATNAVLTLTLALIAWLTVGRMMRPVRILRDHLQAGVECRVEPIPESAIQGAPREFRPLYQSFNDMAAAVREREDLSRQLAEEERLASLGRLASGMAHEINNPLGGLFNAIDTLKEHGARADVRQRTIDLIERGLRGIRDVVRTALATYRADRDTRSLKAADVDDLKLLVQADVRRKALVLDWANDAPEEIAVPAAAARQIILNLLLNACHATPEGGSVAFRAVYEAGRFVATVDDNGPGLSDHAQNVLVGRSDHPPAAGSGTGLGLWMVRRLVKEIGGTVSVSTREPVGTSIRVSIPTMTEEELAHVA